MKSSLKSRSMILAAIATLSLSGIASAQYRVDNSRALDANRLQGSNGFNDPIGRIYDSNNWIVTGDVTAGRQFRGSLGYTDPRAFRGALPSSSFDDFVRGSSGITTGGQESFNAQVVRPYFGVGRGVTPQHPGLVKDLGGGYVPAAPRQFDPADARIDYGGLDTSKVISGLQATPNAGTLPGATARYEMLSSNARLRDATRLDPSGASFLSEYTSLLEPQSKVDQKTLNEMREANTRRPTDETSEEESSADLNGPMSSSLQNGALDQRLNGQDQRLNSQVSDSTSLETGAGVSSRSGKLQTGRNLTLDQLREQQNKLNQRTEMAKLPGAEAADRLRDTTAEIRRAKEAASAEDETAQNDDTFEPRQSAEKPKADADTEKSDENPVATSGQEKVEAPDQAAPEVKVKERPKVNFVDVDSFSKGIADPKINSIVQNAESLMQRQRFASAIVEFDKAEGMSPDDPMVQMGRSVAELGGGYYRRAEIYMRKSIETDKAVLLGRYNLRGLLTDVRLEVILNDLKKVASENPTDSGPLILLGYIYYNSGAEVRGYEYIQKAGTIAGQDPVIDAMLEAWKIEE